MTVRGSHLANYLLANESMNEPVTPFPLAYTAHAHGSVVAACRSFAPLLLIAHHHVCPVRR
jgi:hypothetical protein